MNLNHWYHGSMRWLGALAGACLLAGVAPAIATGPEPPASGAAARVEGDLRSSLHASHATLQFSGSDGDVVVVRVEDGKTTVTLNGKAVPEDRIRHEGDRLIIVDENGNEISSLNVSVVEGGHGEMLFGGRGGVDVEELVVTPETPKAMLGFHLAVPGPALEHHLELEPGMTTMVAGVYEGLPAYEAGLREYDIIVAADGTTPCDPDSLRSLLRSKEPGEAVALKVIQTGRAKELKVKLVPYDAEAIAEATFFGHRIEPDLFGDFKFGEPGGVWVVPRDRRTLIDPDSEEIFERIFINPPELDARIREQLERNLPRWRERLDPPPPGSQEEQIDRLERRLEELTERLNRLLEERDR